MARAVQMSTLPAVMPTLPGYDLYGTSRPASLTGGDTFDLALIDQGLLTVLGDATGHGIAPALSVTQMHAMLRMAFRLGADLETAFITREQPARRDDRRRSLHHRLHRAPRRLDPPDALPQRRPGADPALPGGEAARAHATIRRAFRWPPCRCRRCGRPSTSISLPGDILALLSDGIYEYCDRRQRAIRGGPRRGHPAGASRQADGRAFVRPARRRGDLREGCATGGRHHGSPGETRERHRDGGSVLPSQLRFARGDLRVHRRVSSPPMASTPGSCPPST